MSDRQPPPYVIVPLSAGPQYSAETNQEIAALNNEAQSLNNQMRGVYEQLVSLDDQVAVAQQKGNALQKSDDAVAQEAQAAAQRGDNAAVESANARIVDFNKQIAANNQIGLGLVDKERPLSAQAGPLDAQADRLRARIASLQTRSNEQANSVGPGVDRRAIPDIGLGGKGTWAPQKRTNDNRQNSDYLAFQQRISGGVDPLKYAYKFPNSNVEFDSFRNNINGLRRYPNGAVLDAKTALPKFVDDEGGFKQFAEVSLIPNVLKEARAQLAAARASGTPVIWAYNDTRSALGAQMIFARNRVYGIDVIGPEQFARYGIQ